MPVTASSSGLLNEIWNNPFWNPLNVFVAVIIAVAGFLYAKHREKKELSYIRLSDTSVVNVNKSFAEKVKITYGGLQTKTLQLVRLQIINTGNQPIKKEDHEEPLTFVDLKPIKNGGVSGFYVLGFPEKSPKDLSPETIVYNKRHGIKPLLLNPGDSITSEILNIDLKDTKVVLDVRARIVGVKKIRELKSSYLKQFTFLESFLLAVILGAIFSVFMFIAFYFKLLDLTTSVLLPVILVISTIIIMRNPNIIFKSET